VPWKTPKISRHLLAWLAGLLEGEGCFSSHCYYNRSSRYVVPSIQLAMTDRDIVKRAGALIGGNQKSVRSYLQKPDARLRGNKYKRKYVWRVNGQRAVHVMKLLLPYMGRRRSRRISSLVRKYEEHVGPEGGRGCWPERYRRKRQR
jgi:hypothetical protein